MKLFYVLILTLSLLLQQVDPKLDFPPDPADIFVEGIEVVPVEIVEPQVDARPQADNDARVVRVFDEPDEEWREYPYPDEVLSFLHDPQLWNGKLLLSTLLGRGLHDMQPDPNGQWLLDAETGEYSRPEIICEELRVPPEQSYWVVYDQFQDGKPPELCNLGTGERITLSIDTLGFDTEVTTDVSVSPDGAKALLAGDTGFYVYTFATQRLIMLGKTKTFDIRDAWWLGNDTVMTYETETADMSFPWRYYSLANANQENSLHHVTTVVKPGYLIGLENPPRFEWVQYNEDNTCSLIQIHQASGQIDEYDLYDLCDLGIKLDHDGDRLYSPVDYAENDTAKQLPIARHLIKFNPYTGKRLELLQGEIEYVMDVSADGRYGVIVLDDSGLLDMLTSGKVASMYYQREERPELRPRFALVDLTSGEIIYETDVAWRESGVGFYDYPVFLPEYGNITSNFEPDYAGGPNGGMFDIAPNRFLTVIRQLPPDYTYTLMELGTDIKVTPLDPVLLVLPEADYLILWQAHEDGTGKIVSYRTATGEIKPIIEDVTGSFGIWESSLAVDGRRIHLSQSVDSDEVVFSFYDAETAQTVRYTVRLR